MALACSPTTSRRASRRRGRKTERPGTVEKGKRERERRRASHSRYSASVAEGHAWSDARANSAPIQLILISLDFSMKSKERRATNEEQASALMRLRWVQFDRSPTRFSFFFFTLIVRYGIHVARRAFACDGTVEHPSIRIPQYAIRVSPNNRWLLLLEV